MKFTELDPHFVQLTRTPEPPEKWRFNYVDTLSEADGVMFLCPTHFQMNGGPEGTHSVICWFSTRSIPNTLWPGPGRWVPSGELATLTLSPSVDLGHGDWHGHITNGEVT